MLAMFVTAVLSFAYIVFAGRALGPHAFGEFATANSLILIVTYALGPINPTLTKFIAEYVGRGAHGQAAALYRAGWAFMVRVLIAGCLLGVLLTPLLRSWLRFDSSLTLLVAFGVIALALLASVPRALLRGLEWYDAFGLNNVTEAGTRFVVGVAIVLGLGPVPGVALAAYAVGLAAAIGTATTRVRGWVATTSVGSVDLAPVRRLGRPMFVQAFALAVLQNSDLIIAKRYLAPADVGAYAAATSLAKAIGVLFIPFNTILLPRISTLVGGGRSAGPAAARICALFLLLGGAISAVFWFLSEPLIRLIYGPQFAGGAPLLGLLCLALVLGYLAFLLGQALLAVHDPRFVPCYIAAAVVQVAVLLIYHASALQVALATLICQFAALTGVAVFAWAARGRTTMAVAA